MTIASSRQFATQSLTADTSLFVHLPSASDYIIIVAIITFRIFEETQDAAASHIVLVPIFEIMNTSIFFFDLQDVRDILSCSIKQEYYLQSYSECLKNSTTQVVTVLRESINT
jgi:hypothetical protein